MNLLLRELKANSRSLIIWTLALAVLNFSLMALFPAFAEAGEQMEEFMAMLPEGFARMFGLDRLNLAEPIGFYAIEAYFMVILFGGIFAAILGATMLGKEEDEKTAEFLLAKPVSRHYVVTGKVLAIATQLLAFNIVIGLATLASFEMFAPDYSVRELLPLLAAPFIAQLAMAAIGLLLSVFVTRRKSALSVGIGFVLGFYFLHALAAISDKLESLRFLTPFWYMDAAGIIEHGGLELWKAGVLIGVAGLCVVATYLLYREKDIKI